MCNNATLQRQNTHTRVPHYKRLEIRVLTNILASVSHSTKFKHPVGPQTEHVGREDQDMKSSRKRQTCWDRDEMREIEREISLSVNTSCTGRLWHISFHFMLSLHVCSTAVEPCNMDYTDISIGHINTTLAPKTTFGIHAHTHTNSFTVVSVTAMIWFLKGYLIQIWILSLVIHPYVISNLYASILPEKHKSRMY